MSAATRTIGHPAPVSVRPPLQRARERRILGGVSAGLATHLGLPLLLVRVGFVLALPSGAGVVLYGWLWVLAPQAGDVEQPDPASSGARARRSRLRADLVVGLFLLAAAGVLVASLLGWDVRATTVLPLLMVAAGVAIAYGTFDESERARWLSGAALVRRGTLLRLGLGVGLAAIGALLLVVPGTDVFLLARALVAALAVLAGVALVLLPWGLRLWRDLEHERAARVRERERADIAAHLHDSVLQTLALVQQRSHDQAEVTRLVRAQERDLRGWLYQGAAGDPGTVAARAAGLVAEVEDRHAAVVELVTVGDQDADERAGALLAALREAITNAARHAGTPVRVYLECTPRGIEAFVRDRGPGFDLSAVPADRLGVRESIVARMERHGGSAHVRTEPNEGTEVRLWLPTGQEER